MMVPPGESFTAKVPTIEVSTHMPQIARGNSMNVETTSCPAK
jgi:hypothetical protein